MSVPLLDASNPTLPKVCAQLIAQYIIPIETGFTDALHYADSDKILTMLKENQTKPTITPAEANKGLLTALALRHFTSSRTIRASLAAIALTLLNTQNANFIDTNDQHKQVGPALHIAVLSDKEDGERYADPQATQETTPDFSSFSPGLAAFFPVLIQQLVAHGADETTLDATGKTAQEHAQERYLKIPPLTRQPANARAGFFGWML